VKICLKVDVKKQRNRQRLKEIEIEFQQDSHAQAKLLKPTIRITMKTTTTKLKLGYFLHKILRFYVKWYLMQMLPKVTTGCIDKKIS